MIDSIKKEVPDVFAMVEKASQFAMTHGYVVHNARTNSRRWYTPVIEAQKKLEQMKQDFPDALVPGLPFDLPYKKAKVKHIMDFKVSSQCESTARNTRIQGTQADMVKEAIVEIYDLCTRNDMNITLLGTVHDECIYKHPIGYEVVCPYRNEVVKAGDFIAHAMKTVANRYLNNVEMGADYETKLTWTK